MKAAKAKTSKRRHSHPGRGGLGVSLYPLTMDEAIRKLAPKRNGSNGKHAKKNGS